MDNKKEDKYYHTIMLTYLYLKIKERNKGPMIKTALLKDIIKKHFIISKELGGERKGISRIYIYDIIDDLIEVGLLKKLNHKVYEILPKAKDNIVLKSLRKKINIIHTLYKKNKTISDYKLNQISEELTDLLDLLDNSDYQIQNSSCTKRLKKFPY